MTEIQRLAWFPNGMRPNPRGRWVTFEDHTAALAKERERAKLQEQRAEEADREAATLRRWLSEAQQKETPETVGSSAGSPSPDFLGFAGAGDDASPSASAASSDTPEAEERRWLIQVCDECDDVFESVEDHRHREGMRGLEIDVEVVPAERAEQAEEAVAELHEAAKRALDLRDWCRKAGEVEDEDGESASSAYKVVANASNWYLLAALTQPPAPVGEPSEASPSEPCGTYGDLSYRERVICTERDRGISRERLAERFKVAPLRIAQYENQARVKLATLPLTGERLETLIDRTIRMARASDRPDLGIRAEVLTPYRLLAGHQPVTEIEPAREGNGYFDARFLGGPLDGKVKRLSEAPSHLKVWEHRQARGVIRIDGADLQRSLWDRFDYDRTRLGEGFASYKLHGYDPGDPNHNLRAFYSKPKPLPTESPSSGEAE